MNDSGFIRANDDLLDKFVEVGPFLNEIIPQDIGLSIVKGDIIQAYFPAKTLKLNTKVGDKVGKNIRNCLEKGQRQTHVFDRKSSPFGIPYAVCITPVKNEKDITLGCIAVTQPVDEQEVINNIASELAASSQQFNSAMNDISENNGQLSIATNTLFEIADNLMKTVEETDEIISFIKNIAKQTNLIGLNAAIEAARVGENGKGFGVVAEEIRKLASLCSESVTKISGSLLTINEMIESITEKSGNIAQAVNQQNITLKELVDSSTALTTMAQNLSVIAEKMFMLSDTGQNV